MWPHVGLGALALVCSILIFRNPLANTLGLTLVVGFLLLASGIAKLIGSFVERSTGWGYYAVNGALAILLGGYILYTFPVSAFWTIGTFVAVDLLFSGFSMIGLGYAIRKARKELTKDMQSLLPESYDEMEYRYYENEVKSRDKDRDPFH
ncbi:MAG: DUF308 domain-containing protein, partial [Bdellovibrio sp.]|nr:DUF308 domain-containing protein [Bdellovibrio sp.]